MTNHPRSLRVKFPFLRMCGICGCLFLHGDKVYRNAKKPEILYHEKCGDDWAVPTIWGATKETFGEASGVGVSEETDTV